MFSEQELGVRQGGYHRTLLPTPPHLTPAPNSFSSPVSTCMRRERRKREKELEKRVYSWPGPEAQGGGSKQVCRGRESNGYGLDDSAAGIALKDLAEWPASSRVNHQATCFTAGAPLGTQFLFIHSVFITFLQPPKYDYNSHYHGISEAESLSVRPKGFSVGARKMTELSDLGHSEYVGAQPPSSAVNEGVLCRGGPPRVGRGQIGGGRGGSMLLPYLVIEGFSEYGAAWPASPHISVLCCWRECVAKPALGACFSLLTQSPGYRPGQHPQHSSTEAHRGRQEGVRSLVCSVSTVQCQSENSTDSGADGLGRLWGRDEDSVWSVLYSHIASGLYGLTRAPLFMSTSPERRGWGVGGLEGWVTQARTRYALSPSYTLPFYIRYPPQLSEKKGEAGCPWGVNSDPILIMYGPGSAGGRVVEERFGSLKGNGGDRDGLGWVEAAICTAQIMIGAGWGWGVKHLQRVDSRECRHLATAGKLQESERIKGLLLKHALDSSVHFCAARVTASADDDGVVHQKYTCPTERLTSVSILLQLTASASCREVALATYFRPQLAMSATVQGLAWAGALECRPERSTHTPDAPAQGPHSRPAAFAVASHVWASFTAPAPKTPQAALKTAYIKQRQDTERGVEQSAPSCCSLAARSEERKRKTERERECSHSSLRLFRYCTLMTQEKIWLLEGIKIVGRCVAGVGSGHTIALSTPVNGRGRWSPGQSHSNLPPCSPCRPLAAVSTYIASQHFWKAIVSTPLIQPEEAMGLVAEQSSAYFTAVMRRHSTSCAIGMRSVVFKIPDVLQTFGERDRFGSRPSVRNTVSCDCSVPALSHNTRSEERHPGGAWLKALPRIREREHGASVTHK
ncbi:hypothetical protein JZ751_024506 [Albula glossodonta]|uniref:Uncharacterized protein n=1 Tax=Albula glossodonta TaxID=121402 RepID=A0A8T2PM72_9TELE|nr:hypothetical protein JZ751_024506 [Albula glossodonta]